jgi:hypothetical protein
VTGLPAWILTGTRDLSIPQPDALPVVTVEPTVFRVCPLPVGFPDGDLWTLRLELRADERGESWAVTNRSRSLGADGTWSYGFAWQGGNREPVTEAEMDDYNAAGDAWQAAHRFDLNTAVKLATEAARTVTVMGKTAAEAWREARRNAS